MTPDRFTLNFVSRARRQKQSPRCSLCLSRTYPKYFARVGRCVEPLGLECRVDIGFYFGHPQGRHLRKYCPTVAMQLAIAY